MNKLDMRSRAGIAFLMSIMLIMSVVAGYLMVDQAAADQNAISNGASHAQLATTTLDPRPGYAAATREAVMNELIEDPDTRATVQAVFEAEQNAVIQATIIAITPTPVPIVAPHSLSLGPEDAPVTIVEFSDYQCPFCVRFDQTTRDPLLEHYGDLIRFVFRDYPVVGGETSALAAAAARCAGEQDKYWEYGDLLFDNQYLSPEAGRQSITETLMNDFAQQLELDMEAFEQCLADGTGFNMVVFDFEAGRALDIRGVPAFYIEEQFISGAQPMENFMDVIDAELIEQGIEPPARP